MTTLRPERPADGPMSYEDTGQFAAVVEQLSDPLSDPLPGRPPAVTESPDTSLPPAEPLAPPVFPAPAPERPGADPLDLQPRVRTPKHGRPAAPPETVRPPEPPALSEPVRPPEPLFAPEPFAAPDAVPVLVPGPGPGPGPVPRTGPGTELVALDATAQLPVVLEPPALAPQPAGAESVMAPTPADGGRAARRKAAKQGGGGHRARGRTGSAQYAPAAPAEPSVPLSRVAARQARKAAKESPAVVISRLVGELFITTGVLMLLFVTYQLWWTNVRAHAQANGAANHLQHEWETTGNDPNRVPGTFSPGQGFAIMYIPKLDVKAPIAQGVSKHQVLDKGMIGHYDGALNTAMPWDKSGNFAVAAHRNTHGEPFRYINHLVPGDKVVVETATTYYTYEITGSLASTPPTNISVLRPVPVGSGFTRPGRYLTLTTCTPEFTSTNRLIVWGRLVQEQPRSKGKPDALME